MFDDEESGSPSWSLPRYEENPFSYDYGVFINPDMPSGGVDIFDPANYPRSDENPAGYDPSASYNQPYGSGFNLASLFSGAGKALSGAGKSFLDYIEKNPGKVGIMAALAALGALSKAPPSGGGTTKRYVGPAQQLTRTITQGRYGPIAQYAAQGGIMHAYAHGGQVKPVAMEDGGFVMTKKAVDGAGGPQGIQALLPGAQPIRGPGTGTSDSIPAYIQGRNGLTPARVSNGEAYVPRRAQPPGGTRELYAMMRQLERRA